MSPTILSQPPDQPPQSGLPTSEPADCPTDLATLLIHCGAHPSDIRGVWLDVVGLANVGEAKGLSKGVNVCGTPDNIDSNNGLVLTGGVF